MTRGYDIADPAGVDPQDTAPSRHGVSVVTRGYDIANPAGVDPLETPYRQGMERLL